MNLTRRQFATLRYIGAHDVSFRGLRKYHQGTLGSLLHRKLVGRATGDTVRVTAAGRELLVNYMAHQPAYRKDAKDLTDRCRNLLAYVRVLRRAA